MTLQQSLPWILPIIIVGVLYLRVRPGQERPLNPAQLWIMPVVAGGMIALGLWFSPHPSPTPLHIAILVVAFAAGIGMGYGRAHTIALRRDGDQILAKASSFAFMLLIVLMLLRQGAREWFASSAGAVAIDASMLFALGMIITQRLTMWQRVKRLA
ncbi:hypothetical protein SPAN111604_01960 [Sphingomonas antarctica]|uniref:CcdC protein domain-containing protein n=1 Tax=Sphingomonas antarctica TaxID=2040274 RepID=UPI0039E84E18